MDDETIRKYRRGAAYALLVAAAFLVWEAALGPIVADLAGLSTASAPPDSLRDRVFDTADTPYEYATWAFVAGTLLVARVYDRRRAGGGN